MSLNSLQSQTIIFYRTGPDRTIYFSSDVFHFSFYIFHRAHRVQRVLCWLMFYSTVNRGCSAWCIAKNIIKNLLRQQKHLLFLVLHNANKYWLIFTLVKRNAYFICILFFGGALIKNKKIFTKHMAWQICWNWRKWFMWKKKQFAKRI